VKLGVRHLLGAGVGIAAAGAVSVLLFGGEYEASATQGWAAYQAQAATGPGPAPLPVSSPAAAVAIAGAAFIVGVLCGWRRLPASARLAAGLPLFALGLLTWLDTWRVAQLFGGSLGPPWSRLVTDQVFLVLGGILLVAAALPRRSQPASAGRPPSGKRTSLLAGLGLVAVPVAWYLVQLTNLTVANYASTYWFPFRPTVSGTMTGIFVLVIAVLGALAASRGARVAAVIAGAPMLATSLLALLAPTVLRAAINGTGLSPAWRYAILLDAASGLPLLYGGILVTSGLMPDTRVRRAASAAAAPPAALTATERNG
jgi:hypothetical protein